MGWMRLSAFNAQESASARKDRGILRDIKLEKKSTALPKLKLQKTAYRL
jgi:hypothetical protein